MKYDNLICGKFVDLRSIELEDAEFSYCIRSDKRYRDTVGQPASSVEAQRKFIEWQIQQPGDYYFIVLNKKGQKIGLIGVYDIHDGMGEVGREVNDGSPMEAMEAEILLNEFIRDVLHLKKICYVIYMNNHKNISNQRKKGYEPLRIIKRNGVECAYYEAAVCNDNDVKIKKLLEKIPVEQS